VVNGTLRDYVAQADAPARPVPLFDAIVYINVLEHIEADAEELALAKELLRPGGSVLIVVPAHQWLYARVDQLTGHFRRYSKKLCARPSPRADSRSVS
jgi:2-polyprenyl-3-methyl-5-hydroxy-6-metoxy-1,4-benzoquinol methylase